MDPERIEVCSGLLAAQHFLEQYLIKRDIK